MKITQFKNGMYRIEVQGITVIAPSLRKAIIVAWTHLYGGEYAQD